MAKLFSQRGFSLLNLEKGVEFEVDADHEESSDESFTDEAYETFKDDAVDVDGKNKPRFVGGACIPFDEMKKKMTPITDDGKVLKEVIRDGTGTEIPDKSVVMMHYEFYIENEKQPFDSTRLRRKPFKFVLGDNAAIEGLEIAIKSMRKEENSRFIISPDYAYGTMGCPPRIPQNAEVLAEVEVINFYISKAAFDYEDLSPEEQKAAPFKMVVGVYHCESQMAKDLFQKKNYKPAIARYLKVKNMLENVSAVNEAEDEKRKEYLTKLYLNLAQCYINVQNPQKAVVFSSMALRWEPENTKGLYRKGYALLQLNDFEGSIHYLNKAKDFNPYNAKITKTIQVLEEKQKVHSNWEKKFCQKMFPNQEDKPSGNKSFPEELQFFHDIIKEELSAFVVSDQEEHHFSPGYTEAELEIVKDLAQEQHLAFVSLIHYGEKINKVVKNKNLSQAEESPCSSK